MTTRTRSNPLPRIIAVLALAFGLFAGASATAGAAEACVMPGQEYGSSVVLSTSAPSADNGTSVDIIGSGFPADCELTLQVEGATIGTVTTGPDGAFSFSWTVPDDDPAGVVTITAVIGGAVVASTVLEITDGQAASSTTLPSGATSTTTPGATTPGGSGTGSSGTGSTSGGALPATGAKVLPFALGGLVLLGVGLGLMAANRRRSVDGTI